MKKCINCGAELPDEVLFCEACGTRCDIADSAEETAQNVSEDAVEAENAAEDTVAAAESTAEEAVENAAETEEAVSDSEAEQRPEFDENGEPIVYEDSADEGENVEGTEAGESVDLTEAETQPVKKHGWTKVTTIIVIIAAVVILGLLAFLGYKDGWYEKDGWIGKMLPKQKNSYTIEDYSTIEVLNSDVEVTDDTIESYIEDIQSNFADSDGNYPELTDEWVEETAGPFLGEDLKTVDDLTEYCRQTIYTYYLHSAIYDYLESLITVKAYDEEKEEELIAYNLDNLNYYASYYGIDADTLASYYGATDADEYALNQADSYLTSVMVIDDVFNKLNLTFTEDDLNTELQEYMASYGYDSQYTLDEFKEQSGETWLYLYENLECRYNIAMEALEDRVTFVDDDTQE